MIASDPNQTVEVSLNLDREKPEESRPVFVYRFLTCRQVMRVESLLREAHEAKGNEKTAAKLVEAIRIGMVGWRNVAEKFDPALLLDLLTPMELWELAHQTINATTVKEIDLGKSVSPSDTSAGRGASPATPAAEIAGNSAPN